MGSFTSKSVGSHRTSGKEKEERKERTGLFSQKEPDSIVLSNKTRLVAYLIVRFISKEYI